MTAAILYDNLADAATLDASSWIAAAPPATLQSPHVSRRWKGRNGDSETLSADLLAEVSLDTLTLLGCQYVDADDIQANMTASAITRIRVSSQTGGPFAGDVYDSGSAAGRIDAAYGALVTHLASPVSGRYVDFNLSQSGANALLAGRMVIGLREAFTINFGYGWSYGYGDLSRLKKSAGGQTFVDRDDRYRILNLTFDALDADDRYGFVEEADRLNGISRDVLFVLDPDSATPDRDTIWGLMQDLSPPAQPNLAFFSKSYRIEERL